MKRIIRKSVDYIPVIETLDEKDCYDIIFVVMQYSQLEAVIPYLMNNLSKNIVLVGNNMEAEKFEKRLNGKNVWFGFYSAAGKREATYFKSISLHKITIGSAYGACMKKDFIQDIFSATRIKAVLMDDMDEWLKIHAAFILPLVHACYINDGNFKRIKNNTKVINQIIDEMKGNYEALMKKGYKIVPYSEYEYVTKIERSAISLSD